MTTKRQVAALKYLISISKDGNEMMKRVMFFLLDHSLNLKKEVCLTLTQGMQGYSAEEIRGAAYGVSSMCSCNCTTHLDAIMTSMGTEFGFSIHYGHFDEANEFNTKGMFPGIPKEMLLGEDEHPRDAPLRYTFWLSKDHYSKKAKPVQVTRAELERIDINKPGLYPAFESSVLRSA